MLVSKSFDPGVAIVQFESEPTNPGAAVSAESPLVCSEYSSTSNLAARASILQPEPRVADPQSSIAPNSAVVRGEHPDPFALTPRASEFQPELESSDSEPPEPPVTASMPVGPDLGEEDG